MRAASGAAIILLVALSVFQLALSAGAPLGRFAWGGKHDVLPIPLRVASAGSIAVYAACGAVVGDAGGLTDVFDGAWPPTAAAVLTGYFGLGVIVNGISRSRPERMVMTPVAAMLTLLFLIVALEA